MKTTYSKLVSATVMAFAYFVTLSCEAGLFTLEIVQPSTGPDHLGTLRVMYHDEDDNFSFYNGGLHLQLSSSVGGVIKFHGGEIINSDERWAAAYVRDVADNSIGNLFAASLLTPGLTGTGSRIFADFQYSLIGSGSTELIIDAGGEDPVVEGRLGDIAHRVSSRGLCLGDCLPEHTPTVLNLGESWSQKRALLNPPPAPEVPGPVLNPPVVENPPPAKSPEIPVVPELPEPLEQVDDGPLVITPEEVFIPEPSTEDPEIIEIEQPIIDFSSWQFTPIFTIVDGAVIRINSNGETTALLDSLTPRPFLGTSRLEGVAQLLSFRHGVLSNLSFFMDIAASDSDIAFAFDSSRTAVPEPSGFFLAIASTAAILMRRRLA
jgi:hypothetical protein